MAVASVISAITATLTSIRLMSVNNPRFPHTCTITRSTSSDGPMKDEGEVVTLYDGPCRAYEKNTTSVSGEVITTNRGLSLPLSRTEWSKENVPQEGDEVVVDYGPYTERGQIIDKMVANFHGTHLIWKHVKG